MIVLNLAYNKNKPYKTLDNWSRYLLKFESFGKGLGKISPPDFVLDFPGEMFLMLYSTNWPNLLIDYLYFFRYCSMCGAIFFVNLAVTLIVKLTLLSNQAVFLHDQNVKIKDKHLKNEKS